MKEILFKNINEVIRDKAIVSTLDEIGVSNVGELCNYSRMELNEKGVSNSAVNDIRIALQLNGVDLKLITPEEIVWY